MRNRKFFIFLIFILSLVLSGCGGVSLPWGGKPEAMPENEEVFARAESAFASGDLAGAEPVYREFALAHPGDPMAPVAWMRIAEIAGARQDGDVQRDALASLFNRYPDSAYADDARLGYLKTFLREGRVDRMMADARTVISGLKKDKSRAAAWAMVGDGYASAGVWDQAVLAFAQAYASVGGPEKEKILPRLEKAVSMLGREQARNLAAQVSGCEPKGYLYLHLAKKEMDANDMDLAEQALTSFVQECPEHPQKERVWDLLAELEKMALFDKSSIGCLLPLSGPYGQFGEKLLRGAELALFQYNSLHPEAPVGMAIADTKGTDQGAREGFEALAEQKVCAVIGPLKGARAVKGLAREKQIPAIVFSRNREIPEPGGYLFRNYPTPEMQARTLASYAVEIMGKDRFAILYPDDSYGNNYMNRFWDSVISLGGRVTAVESYEPGNSDISDSVKKLVGLYYERPEEKEEPNPFEDPKPLPEPVEEQEEIEEEEEPPAIVDFDVLFLPEAPSQAGLILPQLKYHDIQEPLIFGTNLWHSGKLREVAGTYAREAIFPDVFSIETDDPEIREFIQAYESAYGEPPDFWAALGYDSARLIFMASHLPRVKSGQGLRNALVEWKQFTGVTGRTAFDDTGESEKLMLLLRVGRKGFEPVLLPLMNYTQW